jgi:hypothetical protein
MYTAGFWSELWEWTKDVAGDLGATPEISAAVAKALAAPSVENIRAVESAYRARGATPPPELMRTLWERYYDTLPERVIYPAPGFAATVTDYLPLLVAGGLVIWALASRRRR